MQVTSTLEVNASNHQRLKSMQVTSTFEVNASNHQRYEVNASNRSQCK